MPFSRSIMALLRHLGRDPQWLQAQLDVATGHVEPVFHDDIQAMWIARWEADEVVKIARKIVWASDGDVDPLMPEALCEQTRRGLLEFTTVENLAHRAATAWFTLRDLEDPWRRQGRRSWQAAVSAKQWIETTFGRPLHEIPEASHAALEAAYVQHPPAGTTSQQASQALRELAEFERRRARVPFLILDLAKYVARWCAEPDDEQKRTALEFLVLQVFFLQEDSVFEPLMLKDFCTTEPLAAANALVRTWREPFLPWEPDTNSAAPWRMVQTMLESLAGPDVEFSDQLEHWLAIRIDNSDPKNAATIRACRYRKRCHELGLSPWAGNREEIK